MARFRGESLVIRFILIRFHASMRDAMVVARLMAVESHGDRVAASFMVIQPGHVRLQKLPLSRLPVARPLHVEKSRSPAQTAASAAAFVPTT